MKFEECVFECIHNKELVINFNRLYGTTIGVPTTSINTMIDRVSGYEQDQYNKFFKFVMQYIWAPLVIKNAGCEQ